MIANVQHWTELISKRLSGNIREEEARMLDAWLSRDPEHREYFQQITRAWEVTGSVSVDTTKADSDWAGIEKRIESPGTRKPMPEVRMPIKMPQISPRILQIAAAVFLVLAVGLTYWLTYDANANQMIVADAGENSREITLPDGSVVTLRKGSTLQYAQEFTTRDVKLQGEAFFSVTHDEAMPFSVAAGHSVVRVLGTKFNLKTSPDSLVELFVEEGRVAFAPAARKFDAKIFSGGQAGFLASTTEAEVERAAAPGKNITSWINGRLVFDHVTLDHVLIDIERHFAVPIEVSDPLLNTCELKADFENATLENVLETLRFSLNLQIDRSGDRYIVSGQPCATEPIN